MRLGGAAIRRLVVRGLFVRSNHRGCLRRVREKAIGNIARATTVSKHAKHHQQEAKQELHEVSEAPLGQEPNRQAGLSAEQAASEEPGSAPASSDASQPTRQRAGETPAELAAQLAAARDRELRLLAELDNARKRAEREIAEERRYANLPLMRDLLPVLDNVFRAIEAGEKSPGAEPIVQGMRLVAEQLESVLRRHHCVRIEAQGAAFDPHQHEAIAQMASDDTPSQHVSTVALHGFRLHDRVVRPSQVVVSSGPAAGSAIAEAEAGPAAAQAEGRTPSDDSAATSGG